MQTFIATQIFLLEAWVAMKEFKKRSLTKARKYVEVFFSNWVTINLRYFKSGQVVGLNGKYISTSSILCTGYTILKDQCLIM